MTPRRAPEAPAEPGESGIRDEGGDAGPPAGPAEAAAPLSPPLARRVAGMAGGMLRLPVRPGAMAAVLAGSALFAAVVAVVSASVAQRWWGAWAAGSYSLAALAVIAFRRHGGALAAAATVAGALIAPLASMPSGSLAQRDEVAVVSRSATLLLNSGSPYEGAAALAAAHSYTAYDPYLPALAAFGIPRAIAGGGVLTDPRVWFGLVFVAAFGASIALLGRARPAWWTMMITASPLIAYPVSTGGDDLPVLGLECLGLALLSEDDTRPRARPVAAGLVLGLAAAMKATAWPGLAVALALVAYRHGGRSAARFVAAAAGVAGLAIVPVALAAPQAMLINTLEFPLGLAQMESPAASVLPGHVIATMWSGGRWVAIGLLVTAAVCVLVSLFIRPPASPQSAGARLALGLSLMFLLGPASRIGYIVYPVGLLAWLALAPGGRWLPGALAAPRPAQPAGGSLAVRADAESAGRAPERRQARLPWLDRRAGPGGRAQHSAPPRRPGVWRRPEPAPGRRFTLGACPPPALRPRREPHPGGGRVPPTSAGTKRR